MVDVLPRRLRSTRGWLAGAVVASGAVALLAVARAFTTSFHHSGYLTWLTVGACSALRGFYLG